MPGRGQLHQKLLALEKEAPILNVTRGVKLYNPVAPAAVGIRLPPEGRDTDSDDCTTRKDYGTHGDEIEVMTNHIRIRFNNEEIYQSTVVFTPIIDSKFKRFEVLRRVLEENHVWKYDGGVIYSTSNLDNKVYQYEMYTVRFTPSKRVLMKDCIALLNIIFRSVLSKLRYTRVGRSLYDPTRALHLPKHKLEVWPGYITSVRSTDGGYMLQTNVSHKMLRTETVLEHMLERYKTSRDNFRKQIEKDLLGAVVMTRYNNKTYRVDEIMWNETPMSTFRDRRGDTIQYYQYYLRQYSITIRDVHQPLLLHRRSEKNTASLNREQDVKIFLIPELCSLTGLTKTLDNDVTARKDIALCTRLSPKHRVEALSGFVRNIREDGETQQLLRQWNIEISDATQKVPARKLDDEMAMLGRNEWVPASKLGQLVDIKQPLKVVNLSHWLVIYHRRDFGRTKNFIAGLKFCGNRIGMRIAPPTFLGLTDDKTETFLDAIIRSMSKNVELILTIVPTERDDRYNAIKQYCYCETGVPSQVIKSATLAESQRLKSVIQKILLQILAKLGGELWALQIPIVNAMIIGVDTYHDPNYSARSSVTGFVASLNRPLTKFHSSTMEESKGEEVSSTLQMLTINALKAYRDENGMLPSRVIIYRDGVGDGMFKVVRQYEVPQIQKAFECFKDYNPEVVFIVVQKRIKTRLFFQEGNRILNPPPGTVLDNTITSQKYYDFYLISQNVGKGTVTPSHYVVIYDTSTLKPDHVQRLTYKLTHQYWNWPGTVRVPNVCLYAHKIAYMVGQHLFKEAAPQMAKSLFYL